LTAPGLLGNLCALKSTIVQHGGSPAIPVPQRLLDACHLQNEVEIEAQGGCLVIRNPQPPRAGWEEAFRQMAAHGDDRLILNDAPATRWDDEEWEW
jgi:antitoxin component of MazEF toxin-antitoxin module